jgi:mono/diheme cytochrome c family protein
MRPLAVKQRPALAQSTEPPLQSSKRSAGPKLEIGAGLVSATPLYMLPMKAFPLLLGVVAVAGAGIVLLLLRGGVLVDATGQHQAMVDAYCAECHNAVDREGGIAFEMLSAEVVAGDAEKFEAAVRKLRGRLMPPPGNPQPAQADIDQFVGWVENTIDEQADAPKAGHVPIQRLTRTEYARAVRDLVGVEIDPREYLPTEIEVDGFTNVAAALTVSPAFLEQYIGVARKVARLAMGEQAPKLASAYYPPPGGDQDDYVDGMPLGTRGGTAFLHNFPADGEYRFNITDLDVGLYPRALETEHTLVLLVDRTEVFRAMLGGADDLALVNIGGAPARAEIMERFANIPVTVAAGVHEVVVTFIERSKAATDGTTFGFTPYGGFSFTGQMRVPRVIGGIEVVGPYEPTGLSLTASREKIFVCEPQSAATERACAERILANIASRAFRRPIDQGDIDRLMPFFDAGRAAGSTSESPESFDAGIEQMLTAVLASPDFLYRAIVPPSNVGEDPFHALNDLELASRLSFFLWSQGPDSELLELAATGDLQRDAVLASQVTRMLADPRADALVSGFALGWLNVDDLESVDPDDRLFPDFSEQLREDFATEIELFLRSVLLENQNVQQLLTAEHTFLNERLARHYGMTSVRGPQFRRVTLADETRHGLLGKAAVLLRTSYGDRTSPVLRGAWVLEKLMGTPPAPPPPNVETDLTTPEGEQAKTVRVRLEQHREDQSCNGCHGVIDPYGLALENFGATGRWRDVDSQADAPIDASTVLPGGAPITGPVELRHAMLRRPDQFVQALTQKLMMYALGRELEYYDMPQIRAVVRAAERRDYRFSEIVAGIVKTDAFRLQALPEVAEIGSSRAALNASE